MARSRRLTQGTLPFGNGHGSHETALGPEDLIDPDGIIAGKCDKGGRFFAQKAATQLSKAGQHLPGAQQFSNSTKTPVLEPIPRRRLH